MKPDETQKAYPDWADRETMIERMPFVIDETPYCLADPDIKQRNQEFINSIDAAYFSHSADLHAGMLETEQ